MRFPPQLICCCEVEPSPVWRVSTQATHRVLNLSTTAYGLSVGSTCIQSAYRCDVCLHRHSQMLVTFRTRISNSRSFATNTIKFRVKALETYWTWRVERCCKTPCTQIPRVFNFSRTTSSGICLLRVLNSRRRQQSFGREKVWNVTSLRPSRDLNVLNFTSEAVSDSWDKHQLVNLIWTENLLWHEVRIHDKKPHVSLVFCHSPAGATL